jgi:aminoglycoside phosphotransferase
VIARIENVQGGHRPDVRSAAAEASRLTRRLDWRFLLPDPHLRRVIHVGPPTSILARALEAFSESVVFADSEVGARGEIDLVVAEGATLQQAEAVLPQLVPGGWLYWEPSAGQTMRPEDLKALERWGIPHVQAFWHCGGFENRRWIVPLDQPGGLAMFLKRRFADVPSNVLRRMAGLLAHSRTLRRRLSISLIGCRAPVKQSAMFVQRFVEAQRHSLEPAPSPPGNSYVIATPTFSSSRSVVFLMNPGPSCEPTLVAKIARAEADGDPLAREARNLRAVYLAHPGVEAPRLMAHGLFERRAILVESAVPGRLLQPRLVRRRPAACLEAVLQWLEEFHRATRTTAWHLPGRMTALVTLQLKRLESIVAQEAAAPELLLRVRRATSRLDSLSVPLVFEHGDLSSPNLLILGNGRVGVLDWELGDPRGLPAVDLFFFLAFIAFARERATTPERCVAAFRDAFFGPKAWAHPYIARYAAVVGVPRAALVPLFLLCWSRYLANLPARMGWAVGRDLRWSELAEVRRDRYWHLWKYAAEHVDDLQFTV